MKSRKWKTQPGFVRVSAIHRETLRLEAQGIIQHPINLQSLHDQAKGRRQVGRANFPRRAIPFPVLPESLKHESLK